MAKQDTSLSEVEKKDLDDRRLKLKCFNLEALATENRRKFDWEWMVRTLYVRGYHFARYNDKSNTVIFSSRTGVKLPINLTALHLRGVRNQVTSFEPKWEVLPNITTERAFDNARYSGKTLDYIYEKSHIKRKIKEAVTDALIYSIGIWYFDIAKNGRVIIRRVDPFDFYADPNLNSPDISDPEDGAEFVIITHQVAKEAVLKNKEYENTEGLQADNLVASAQYKQFLLQVTKNNGASGNKEDNQTIMVKEAYLRERQESGDIKIRMITYVDQVEKPLQNALLDTDKYPFEVLQGDIYPGGLYGEAWIKNLIPINRVIDALESHIFEYNHLFARGRFVIDKNSGVRLIVNEHGQIIEKNRGSTVTSLPISPLPPSPEAQIDRMIRRFEDISGLHDVSFGRMPGSLRSGTALAELKQNDASNQADLIDNMQDFLCRAGRKILNLVAENWTTTKLVSVTGLGGKPEYFMAIGEDGKAKKKTFKYGEKELPLAVIGRENEVRVQVGSWLAYTKEARQEKLKEFYRLGAIDQKTFLEHAEFADIDNIVKRTREEQVLQSSGGKKSESIQKEFGIDIDDQALAMAENELMKDGIQQFAHAQDDHDVHITIHEEQANDPLTAEHIIEHENYQKWVTRGKTQPVPEDQGIPQEGLPQGQELPPELAGMFGGGGLPPAPPQGPETFQMSPPVGAGAPPFNPNQPTIL